MPASTPAVERRRSAPPGDSRPRRLQSTLFRTTAENRSESEDKARPFSKRPGALTLRRAHAPLGEQVGDIALRRLGGGDVGVTARDIALLPPCHATAVQRVRAFRIDLESLVVLGDRLVEAAELQQDEAAGSEGDDQGPEPQPFVAVGKGCLQVADDRAGMAAGVHRTASPGSSFRASP